MPIACITNPPFLRHKDVHKGSLWDKFNKTHNKKPSLPTELPHPSPPLKTPSTQTNEPAPSLDLIALERSLSSGKKPIQRFNSGLHRRAYMRSFDEVYTPYRPQSQGRQHLNDLLEEPRPSDDMPGRLRAELDSGVVATPRAELDINEHQQRRRSGMFRLMPAPAPTLPEFDEDVFQPLEMALDDASSAWSDDVAELHAESTGQISDMDKLQARQVEGKTNELLRQSRVAELDGVQRIYMETSAVRRIVPQDPHVAELDGTQKTSRTALMRRRKAVRRAPGNSPVLVQKWQRDMIHDFEAGRRYAELFEGTNGWYVVAKADEELCRAESWRSNE